MPAFGSEVPNDDDRLLKPFSNAVIWRPNQLDEQNIVLAFDASVLLAQFFHCSYSVRVL